MYHSKFGTLKKAKPTAVRRKENYLYTDVFQVNSVHWFYSASRQESLSNVGQPPLSPCRRLTTRLGAHGCVTATSTAAGSAAVHRLTNLSAGRSRPSMCSSFATMTWSGLYFFSLIPAQEKFAKRFHCGSKKIQRLALAPRWIRKRQTEPPTQKKKW